MRRSLFFNKVAGTNLQLYLKRETLAFVSSCEFCEIFKNAFFKEHLHTNTSDISQKRVKDQFAILITSGADSATNRRVRVSFNKICFSVTLEKQSKLIAL